MEITIEPDPGPQEHEALVRALRQPPSNRARGSWWQAGLRELVIGLEQDGRGSRGKGPLTARLGSTRETYAGAS